MSAISQNAKEIRAISVSAWFDPFVSISIITLTYLALYKTSLSNVHLALVIVLATSAYLFTSELSRAKWKFSDRPKDPIGAVVARAITKFLGVLVAIIAIFFFVWLLPEYQSALRMAFIREAVLPFLLFVVPAAFILILATEYILGEKKDGTYQFGLLARLQLHEINRTELWNGVLEWLVRGIFLLINFFSGMILISRLRETGLPNFGDNYVEFVMSLDSVLFTLIIFSILPGYIFASRLIGTEVKKVDHTWFGWMITLSSYSPLNTAVTAGWTRYVPRAEEIGMEANTPLWAHLVGDHLFILYTLGALILFMAFIHLWSEAQLGIRSANLSIRGIITTGAFRITKHPVYASKCFQWAFLYLPFLNAIGVIDSFRFGLLFLIMCAIFAGRAFAEEKLLAEDKDYVRYALFMDDKSVFAFIGKIFPFMTFRWRYEFWKRNGYLQDVTSGQRP